MLEKVVAVVTTEAPIRAPLFKEAAKDANAKSMVKGILTSTRSSLREKPAPGLEAWDECWKPI